MNKSFNPINRQNIETVSCNYNHRRNNVALKPSKLFTMGNMTFVQNELNLCFADQHLDKVINSFNFDYAKHQ